ncbi:cobalamin biosynthesis protein CobW [Pseudonocardiaceae bacterium YIM PH 21723]|nr:cobalamin biosynthesis protein CobW [Pseudonocardiaceae bacterium YIM PH 21723]
MVNAERVPVVLVAGLAAEAATEVANRFAAEPDTAVVHHDLRTMEHGVVWRRLRWGGQDESTPLELAHGCVSCTLREDLLPTIRELAMLGFERIVVHLDPALEPEAICWALRSVVIEEETLDERVFVEAVITALDLGTWLADATGDELLDERGLRAGANDERTVAQVVVGQVEFADTLVFSGSAGTLEELRTVAVLERLVSGVPQVALEDARPAALLAGVPETARRGEPDSAHGPLLRGQPPLGTDAGVVLRLFYARRPFHPGRLHAAFDLLLQGVVRARGRVWLASRPEHVLWVDSAGGGLRIGHAGRWLASTADWSEEDEERTALAALRWDDYYGDREQSLVVLCHDASPAEITAALDAALLTDEELAAGEAEWRAYPDPFGEWHTEPCDENADVLALPQTRKDEQ